ncbi:hypothetical protein [Streptomyces sp. NPDC059819]|uniref:hypothetical protein n=1 Tax=Streptomyces sp. NPDC059819 TaxID=3346963 RepID=UPI0036506A65
MTVMLWRQVAAALNDDSLHDATRTRILARGAVQLAVHRTPWGQSTTPEDVMAVAFQEFELLLDRSQAEAAMEEAGPAHG